MHVSRPLPAQQPVTQPRHHDPPVTEIIDTTPAFEEFAAEAALESPVFREKLWRERYEGAYPDVFEGYYATLGSRARPTRMVRELAAVRRRVRAYTAILQQVIEDIDPIVRDLVQAPLSPAPVHVLMVGTGATNAIVGRLCGRVAVYHCLEWTQPAAAARVLTAHESTHAWQQTFPNVEAPKPTDLAWLMFWEGVAIQTSRIAVPDRPEQEYFWYGLAGFETWPDWCRARRVQLRERILLGIDGSTEAEAEAEAMFTGQVAGEPSRTGYFVADDIVGGLRRTLPELARTRVADARSAVRVALERG